MDIGTEITTPNPTSGRKPTADADGHAAEPNNGHAADGRRPRSRLPQASALLRRQREQDKPTEHRRHERHKETTGTPATVRRTAPSSTPTPAARRRPTFRRSTRAIAHTHQHHPGQRRCCRSFQSSRGAGVTASAPYCAARLRSRRRCWPLTSFTCDRRRALAVALTRWRRTT
jgi:hypothetical protein